MDIGTLRGTPIISQDEDNIATRLQRQACTFTQQYLFHMMDIPGLTAPFTNQHAAARRYPLQFLCDFALAVLDEEIGDLLEYRHLLKHPKYRDIWSKSFGTEIRQLATTTKTIVLCPR